MNRRIVSYMMSYIPYSSVVKVAVYKGTSKKLNIPQMNAISFAFFYIRHKFYLVTHQFLKQQAAHILSVGYISAYF